MSSWMSRCCKDTGISSGMRLGYPGYIPWVELFQSLMYFRTVMPLAVCMQAVTHSVANVPSRQAVKLVIGPAWFC